MIRKCVRGPSAKGPTHKLTTKCHQLNDILYTTNILPSLWENRGFDQ